jgi:hypothetical protein
VKYVKTYSTVLRFTKTVKLDVIFSENCAIERAEITGDFFVYPEDALEVLENALKGCSSAECVENAFLSIHGSIVLGFDVESLKRKIVEALSTCSSQSFS